MNTDLPPKKNQNQRHHRRRRNRELVELRNLMASSFVEGRNQFLQFRGRSQAAKLYRENWDGCRDLWKLAYHARKVNFRVL
jgi:hypothetical protein